MFADDIAILADSEKNLERNLNVWNEVLKTNDMIMNIKKTKVMVVANEEHKIEIKIRETSIEQVDKYCYWGVTIDKRGKFEHELNDRITKANNLYYAINQSFIGKREISEKTKLTVYKAIYLPILTYGCESWVLTTHEKGRIQAMEMKYF